MRGLRGALGFFATSVWRVARLGRVPEASVGVVETFMSFGRIVPAMMAVFTRRGGAQCLRKCVILPPVAQRDRCAYRLRRRGRNTRQPLRHLGDSLKAES